MSEEANKTLCKGPCGQLKLRIKKGKYNKKDPKYTDENNKLWNGQVCPLCHKDKMRDAMKARRAPKNDVSN